MKTAVRQRPIVLVTSLLGGGGAERILVTMADWWARHGSRVVVVVLRQDDDGAVGFPVHSDVEVIRLRLISEHNAFWQPAHLTRLLRLRRTLMRLEPRVVIPFLDKLNVAILLAVRGTGIRVVATEHLTPWHNPLGWAWESLRRQTYPVARAIVSPTDRITPWLRQRMRGQFETLPSPAMNLSPADQNACRRKVICAAGRLAPQKGFDRLLPVAARVLRRHPDWSLEIAGVGPDREHLQARAGALGLGDRVRLLGAVVDLPSLMRSTEVFVLSSRHEAYPMVLCEALAAGCAVLATDCETGPREILGDPPAGRLMDDQDSTQWEPLLEQVMIDAALRRKLQQDAVRRAPALQADQIMPGWDERLQAWAPV